MKFRRIRLLLYIRKKLDLYYSSIDVMIQCPMYTPRSVLHCVGYAAFTATVFNTLFRKVELKDWKATPVVGHLYLLGMNVHLWFDSPFLADHDFVLIENKTTGERLLVDPTISDYLDINFVTER